MPDELTDELIRLREKDRDTTRQLGELAKVTGIQNNKSGVIKIFVKRWITNYKSVAGEALIWGNSKYGFWGTGKWNPGVTGSSFILGNTTFGILGFAELGSQGVSDWEINEINDYPGLLGPNLIAWYEFEDLDGDDSLESSI